MWARTTMQIVKVGIGVDRTMATGTAIQPVLYENQELYELLKHAQMSYYYSSTMCHIHMYYKVGKQLFNTFMIPILKVLSRQKK